MQAKTKFVERPIQDGFADVHRKVKNLLITQGRWAKRTFATRMTSQRGKQEPCFCLLGALRSVQYDTTDVNKVRNASIKNDAEGDYVIALATAICETFPTRIDNEYVKGFMKKGRLGFASQIVVGFNDNPNTTVEDLALVVDQAATYDVIQYPERLVLWGNTTSEQDGHFREGMLT